MSQNILQGIVADLNERLEAQLNLEVEKQQEALRPTPARYPKVTHKTNNSLIRWYRKIRNPKKGTHSEPEVERLRYSLDGDNVRCRLYVHIDVGWIFRLNAGPETNNKYLVLLSLGLDGI